MTQVSALVPTYNRAAFIEGAIETVLGQTHDDIEAVVVDDGSTDRTREVLQQYDGDDRVRVFHNERNRGIADSFNRAAEEARGEYLCILGDDDRWHPRKVEKQVAVMERLGEEYAVVRTWGVLRKDGRLLNMSTSNWRGDIYPEIMGSFELRPHSSHMIRRACFEAVGGFDTDFDRAVDWEMNIRLAREYEFEYIPEFLTERHLHGTNTPKTDYVASYNQLAIKYGEERRRYPAVERTFRARWHRVKGWDALVRGEHSAGVRHYATAFRQNPSPLLGFLVVLSVFGPETFDIAKEIRGALVRCWHMKDGTPFDDTRMQTAILHKLRGILSALL